MSLYPLLLEPIYKEKVWGGRALERLGRRLPGGPETRIGESWELADLGATSASGGGGGAARSRVVNGPLAERTLSEVLNDFAPLVTGRTALTPDGAFPLLLKYLDARENLSVQVHPSPDYAAAHPDAHLKSEAWYVVDAEPGAVLYKGVREGTTPDALAAAIEDGSVPELLVAVPARPGECHYLPSGTCHALGSGIVVAEVQTPSDTTFRVFDWGRSDRELHVERAMACIDFGPVDASAWQPGTSGEEGGATWRDLVDCEHFHVREWSIPEGGERTLQGDGLVVLMVVRGGGRLSWGSDELRELPVPAASTVLLPAALSGADVRAVQETKLLEITLPEAEPHETPSPAGPLSEAE